MVKGKGTGALTMVVVILGRAAVGDFTVFTDFSEEQRLRGLSEIGLPDGLPVGVSYFLLRLP